MGRSSKKKAGKSTTTAKPDGVLMAKPVSELEVERRLRPAMEALYSDRLKQAMKICSQGLAKRPGWPAARALRACCLLKLGQREEALAYVREIREDVDKGRVPIDEDGAIKLTMFYRDVRKIELAAEVYELAWQAEPAKVTLGEAAYSMYIRAHKFSEAQRTALRLLRSDGRKTVSHTMLMACAAWLDIQLKRTASNPPEFDPRMLKLASMRVLKVLEGNGAQSMEIVRFAVQLLIDAEDFESAKKLINSPQLLVGRNEYMRWGAMIEKRGGNDDAAAEVYRQIVTGFDPDDWNSWTQYFALSKVELEGNDEAWGTVNAACEVADDPRYKNRIRGPYLARMELLMREKKTEDLRDEIIEYFGKFATKKVCAGDLRPFIGYLVSENAEDNLFDMFESMVEDSGKPSTHITLCWLLLWNERLDITPEQLMEHYHSVKDTPAEAGERLIIDDYILLAVHKLLPFWKGDERYADKRALINSIALLEYGVSRSENAHSFKVLLTVLYMQLKYTERGFAVWQSLGVRHIQLATLPYMVLNHLFVVADYHSLSELFSSMEQLWREIDRELPDSINQAFNNSAFHTSSSIVLLRHRLKRSAFLSQAVLIEALTSLNRPESIGDTVGIEHAWDLVGESSRFPCGPVEAAQGLTYSPDHSVLEFWNVNAYNPNNRLVDERDDPNSEFGRLVSPQLQTAIFSETKATRRVLALMKGKDDVSLVSEEVANDTLKSHASSVSNGDSVSESDPDNTPTIDHFNRAAFVDNFTTLLITLKRQLNESAKYRDENVHIVEGLNEQVASLTMYLRDGTSMVKNQAKLDTAEQFMENVPDILARCGALVGSPFLLVTLGVQALGPVLMQKSRQNRRASQRASGRMDVAKCVESAIRDLKLAAVEAFSNVRQALRMVIECDIKDSIATNFNAPKVIESLPEKLDLSHIDPLSSSLPRNNFVGKLAEDIVESYMSSARRLERSVELMGQKLKLSHP